MLHRMVHMFRRLIGYYKEQKSESEPKLDLVELQRYISKKYTSARNNIKNFKTPLDVGKYQLALMLQTQLCEKTKTVDVINYEELRLCLFIAYKINEFLEHPDLYSSTEYPIKSVFTSRDRDGKKPLITAWKEELIKAGRDDIVEEGAERIVEFNSAIEMKRLWIAIKQILLNTTPPDELPDSLKTGSGVYYRYSELHTIIHGLYRFLPKAEEKLTITR